MESSSKQIFNYQIGQKVHLYCKSARPIPLRRSIKHSQIVRLIYGAVKFKTMVYLDRIFWAMKFFEMTWLANNFQTRLEQRLLNFFQWTFVIEKNEAVVGSPPIVRQSTAQHHKI